MTLTQWLDKMERMCRNATPGEWWAEFGYVYTKKPYRLLLRGTNANDAEFAAQAHTALPQALRIIRALTQESMNDLTEIAEAILNEGKEQQS